jgi:hypothetical protein
MTQYTIFLDLKHISLIRCFLELCGGCLLTKIVIYNLENLPDILWNSKEC